MLVCRLRMPNSKRSPAASVWSCHQMTSHQQKPTPHVWTSPLLRGCALGLSNFLDFRMKASASPPSPNTSKAPQRCRSCRGTSLTPPCPAARTTIAQNRRAPTLSCFHHPFAAQMLPQNFTSEFRVPLVSTDSAAFSQAAEAPIQVSTEEIIPRLEPTLWKWS